MKLYSYKGKVMTPAASSYNPPAAIARTMTYTFSPDQLVIAGGWQGKGNAGLCGLLPLYDLCPTLYLTRRHLKEQGVRGAEHPVPRYCELFLVCTPSDCHLLGSCKESY